MRKLQRKKAIHVLERDEKYQEELGSNVSEVETHEECKDREEQIEGIFHFRKRRVRGGRSREVDDISKEFAGWNGMAAVFFLNREEVKVKCPRSFF